MINRFENIFLFFALMAFLLPSKAGFLVCDKHNESSLEMSIHHHCIHETVNNDSFSCKDKHHECLPCSVSGTFPVTKPSERNSTQFVLKAAKSEQYRYFCTKHSTYLKTDSFPSKHSLLNISSVILLI